MRNVNSVYPGGGFLLASTNTRVGRLVDFLKPEGVKDPSQGLAFGFGGGKMVFSATVGAELGEVPVPPCKDVSGFRVKVFQGVEHRRAECCCLAITP